MSQLWTCPKHGITSKTCSGCSADKAIIAEFFDSHVILDVVFRKEIEELIKDLDMSISPR